MSGGGGGGGEWGTNWSLGVASPGETIPLLQRGGKKTTRAHRREGKKGEKKRDEHDLSLHKPRLARRLNVNLPEPKNGVPVASMDSQLRTVIRKRRAFSCEFQRKKGGGPQSDTINLGGKKREGGKQVGGLWSISSYVNFRQRLVSPSQGEKGRDRGQLWGGGEKKKEKSHPEGAGSSRQLVVRREGPL